MKILTFRSSTNSHLRLGAAVSNGRVLDLAQAYANLYRAEPPDWFDSVGHLLRGGAMAMSVAQETLEEAAKGSIEEVCADSLYSEESIDYAPPILDPGKIICVAVNYGTRLRDGTAQTTDEPYFFLKNSDTVIGNRQPIVKSKTSKQCDAEGELAVVIGKEGKYISRADAYAYVAGYTIFNDVTFRDRRTLKSDPSKTNWLHSKSLDTASPIGPCVVTKDEMTSPDSLEILLSINGERKGSKSTKEMTHNIPELVEYVSNGITLRTGDIISTGAPTSVFSATRGYLKEGDVVDVYVDKIGRLSNPVIGEP